MTYVPIVSGTAILPSGAIIAVTEILGDALPADLIICDGNNGTPDLRDRFILGAGPDHPVGETGDGEKIIVVT